MSQLNNQLLLVKSLWRNRQLIRVSPAINRFMARYMGKFKLQNVAGQLILHSHLPPLTSRAFTRFVELHLLARVAGPSHAQIAVTNACPQHCQYCYNKHRTGVPLDTETIIQTIGRLRASGVVWLGLTGGEPLQNPDLVRIVRSAGPDCAVKLFTTGHGLTPELAAELAEAGLAAVSVSLDHWQAAEHDRVRGCQGAHQTALAAIEVLQQHGGYHVSVSTVVSREMIQTGQIATLIQFLRERRVHELWLSETKPTVEAFQQPELVITEEERLSLVQLQDRYNREGQITINYLGHFEGKEHFGCNAGTKMVYVDAYGEVSPCVFLPMTFGNLRDRPIEMILTEMRGCFASEGRCFINQHYQRLRQHGDGQLPLNREASLALTQAVKFGPPSEFYRLYSQPQPRRPDSTAQGGDVQV